VLASLLLGMRRPALPGHQLVRAAAAFGLSENATRVALSRMVASGELAAGEGEYRLAGSLLDRHGHQEMGRRRATLEWDGSWVMAVVGAGGTRRAPADRAALRRRLAGLRLAEWREGLWVRPDNLGPGTVAALGDSCQWWTGGRPAGDGDDVRLAAELWDLGAWAATAAGLRRDMRAQSPADIPRGFEVAAAVVRHLRDDPLLPIRLLPGDWPGDVLRVEYEAFEVEFQEALRPVLAGLPQQTVPEGGVRRSTRYASSQARTQPL
jgi:phenylacetic acid degradation operon negative regulatory protein